jgi:hypothetical protein
MPGAVAMPPTFADIQKANPARTPDWRWQRALSLVRARQRFSSKRDDDVTGRAVDYLRAVRDRSSHRRRNALEEATDIRAARRLYKSGGELKSLVEARLLTGQSPTDIARCSMLTRLVIETYEALFFQVADRLEAPDWIHTYAISRWTDGLWRPSPATLLKRFAYGGGVPVLEAVAPLLLAPGGIQLVGPAEEWRSPLGRRTLLARLAVAVEVLPFTSEWTGEVQEMLAQIRRADERTSLCRRRGFMQRFGLDFTTVADELASETGAAMVSSEAPTAVFLAELATDEVFIPGDGDSAATAWAA